MADKIETQAYSEKLTRIFRLWVFYCSNGIIWILQMALNMGVWEWFLQLLIEMNSEFKGEYQWSFCFIIIKSHDNANIKLQLLDWVGGAYFWTLTEIISSSNMQSQLLCCQNIAFQFRLSNLLYFYEFYAVIISFIWMGCTKKITKISIWSKFLLTKKMFHTVLENVETRHLNTS